MADDDAYRPERRSAAVAEVPAPRSKDELHNRLQTLIARSNIYVSFISKKLETQQEALRAAAEKEKEKAEAAEEGTEKNGAQPAEKKGGKKEEKEVVSTRRTTRNNAASTVTSDEKTPKTTKRGKPASRKQPAAKKPTTITEYFKKSDLPVGNGAPKAATAAAPPKTALGEQEDLRPAQQPKLITGGIMKDYQLEGLYWLVSLYENGLNGILADEMGLGKTLQTISFLAFLKEKKVNGPFLIAAPVSTLSNWVDEIERFAPDMPAVMYHGHPDHREELRRTVMNPKNLGPTFPIVCTSYEIIMKDRKHLQRFSWKYIIIDEGHRIKNLNCKLIKELKSYQSANRLLLTGTPLQNNLSELWSLLNFLLPEVFDDLAFFQEYFDFSGLQGDDAKGREEFIKEEREANLIGSLHALLKPFLLRRVKTDVLTEMPPKREYVLYAPLTKTQKELYGRLLNHDAREWLLEKIMSTSTGTAKVNGVNGTATTNGAVKASAKGKRKFLEVDDGAAGGPSLKRSRSTTPINDSGTSTPKSGVRTSARRAGKKQRQRSYRELSDDEWFDAVDAGEFDTPSSSEPELDDYQKSLLAALKQVNNKKLQNLLIQLRQACNSPHLFYWPFPEDPESDTDSEHDAPKTNGKKTAKKTTTTTPKKPKKHKVDYAPLVTESGKLLLLERLLPALFARDHKVLIFSQFSSMLDIIETWATAYHNWQCCRIDGSVPQSERREQIKSFNTDPDVKLFLLSTRAGGLGINLTAADTVVLFDSDWNPQADLQAQDRAHRIGQTKPVVVYRLATANTVEQTLLEKAEGKRRLERLVIQKGKFKDLKNKVKGDEVEEELSQLLKEEFEKVNVVQEGGAVLNDRELERLLDRSEKAFENREGVGGGEGMTGVKVV